MAAVATFTKSGNKASTPAKLNKGVFGVTITHHQLLQQAYVAYLANGRTNNASTLKRGQVRGGGKKPWRQKGTGRARFGSSRNPIWTGGGVAFGPTGEENYTKRLNVAAKRQALRQALSLASQENKIIVIEDLKLSGKTQEASALFTKMGAQGQTLVVVETKQPEMVRAIRNLSSVQLVQAKYLNVFDTLNAGHIIFTKAALSIVDEWLTPQPVSRANSAAKKEEA